MKSQPSIPSPSIPSDSMDSAYCNGYMDSDAKTHVSTNDNNSMPEKINLHYHIFPNHISNKDIQ